MPASITPSAKNLTVRTDTWSAHGGLRGPAPGGHEGGPLLRPVTGLGAQRDVDPAGQPPGLGRDQVGLDVRRRERRLLRPGHSGGGEQPGGPLDGQDLLGQGRRRGVPDHEVHGRPLDKGPERRPVRAAGDRPGDRVRRGPVDAGPAQGLAVDPGAVVVRGLQDDRPVGDGGVQPGRVEQCSRRESGFVRSAHDPLVVGVPGRVATYLLDDLGDGAQVADGGTGELDPAPQRVHMTVAEGRQHGRDVEHLARSGGQCQRVLVERHDQAVAHRHGAGQRRRGVTGADPAAQDQVDPVAGHGPRNPVALSPRCWTSRA